MANETVELGQRLSDWYKKAKDQPDDKRGTEKLLVEGYQLFFDCIDPLKDDSKVKNPNSASSPQVYLHPFHYPELKEFNDLFGKRYNQSFGVNIYGYIERIVYKTTENEASVRLTANDNYHGEKLIQVFLDHDSRLATPYNGQIYIEDRRGSWVRSRTNGIVEQYPDNNLADYPGLLICKLAVVVADGFAKETAKKQSSIS
jgi:hypothetical protein